MTVGLKDYSDVHYTQERVAKTIIEHFKPSGATLEPFKGAGVFYNLMTGTKDWCEIEQGRDFFRYQKQVDWIVTNPPFSNLTDVMKHCFEIAENTVLLVPLSKIYSSAPRMKLIRQKAGVVEKLHFGSGRDIGFDLGFPFAAIHFKRGYRGSTIDSYAFDDAA